MRIGIAQLGRVAEDTGGRNYLVNFLSGIRVLGGEHEFVLFLSEGESALLGVRQTSGLEIVEISDSKRTPLHKVWGEQWKLPGRLKKAKLDIVYYPGNFAAYRTPVPYVVNIRGMAHYYGAEYGVDLLRRSIRKLIMPFSVRRAARVITPSHDIQNDVIKFIGCDIAKMQVIAHGVDTSLFDGDANRNDLASLDVLRKFDLVTGGYLLYASALWPYKNQATLIKAHHEVVQSGRSELHLVLAGKGTGTDESYARSLHALADELGTSHLVHFTGQLAQTELRYLYAHALTFVFPSLYESFGNPIFEAWSSGIPIVASKVHSFPEIVGDAGLLVDALSTKEMASAIAKIIDNQELRVQLISRGKARVGSFTWEKCVIATLRLIEQAALRECAPPKA